MTVSPGKVFLDNIFCSTFNESENIRTSHEVMFHTMDEFGKVLIFIHCKKH